MDASGWIALAGVLSGLWAFWAGLKQYKTAQAWKRAEFVALEIKEAFADRAVRAALQLVDWNFSHCDLRVDDADTQLREVPVNDAILCQALMPHTLRPAGFNKIEARIRIVFDELLGRLQRFEHFIEAGLVEKENFYPYLRYWLDILGDTKGKRKPIPVLHSIWRYIDHYGYNDVQRFFGRYGYDIKSFSSAVDAPSATDISQLMAAPMAVAPTVEGVFVAEFAPKTAQASPSAETSHDISAMESKNGG